MASNFPSSAPLIVLSAGREHYRSYALAEMSGTPLILLDSARSAWADEHVLAQLTVDLSNRPAVLAAVGSAIGTYGPLGGVVTYAEDQIEQAAVVAAHHLLPGPAPEAVAACRDKARTRQLLAAHGVPSARHRLPADQQQAVDAAIDLGFPVVVKPRSLAGSVAVRRCDTPQQVAAAYDAADSALLTGLSGPQGVLVEEYLTGAEISAECAVTDDGTVHVIAVTRKVLGAEPHFEEIGHSVDGTDPLLTDPRLQQVAAATVAAIGYTSGVLHIELRMTPTGPAVIEVNGRQAGDLIPHLVNLATGISLPRIAIQLATGSTPDLTPTRHAAASIAFEYPSASGIVQDVPSPGGPQRPWIERHVRLHSPGDHVRTPADGGSLTDRLAYTVVTGPDAETCSTRQAAVAGLTPAPVRRPVHTSACVR